MPDICCAECEAWKSCCADLERTIAARNDTIAKMVSRAIVAEDEASRAYQQLDDAQRLVAAHMQARADAMRGDYDLSVRIIDIESLRAEDYGGLTPERAWEIHQTLIEAATKNAEERNAVAAQLAELRHLISPTPKRKEMTWTH